MLYNVRIFLAFKIVRGVYDVCQYDKLELIQIENTGNEFFSNFWLKMLWKMWSSFVIERSSVSVICCMFAKMAPTTISHWVNMYLTLSDGCV